MEAHKGNTTLKDARSLDIELSDSSNILDETAHFQELPQATKCEENIHQLRNLENTKKR